MSATEDEVRRGLVFGNKRRNRNTNKRREQQRQGGQGGQGASTGDSSGFGSNPSRTGSGRRQGITLDISREDIRGATSAPGTISGRSGTQSGLGTIPQIETSISSEPIPTQTPLERQVSSELEQDFRQQSETLPDLSQQISSSLEESPDALRSFQFQGGEISTRSRAGAEGLASGTGLQGGQVPTFNTDNLLASQRTENIQNLIARGRAAGRPASEILGLVRELRSGNTGRSDLQKQLDRVDTLERRGSINSSVAQARRNSINSAINAENRTSIDARQQSLGESQASQQALADTQRAGQESFQAQTERAKLVAEDVRQRRLDKQGRLGEISKLNAEQIPLSTQLSTFGVEALQANPKANKLLTDIRAGLGTNPTREDITDALADLTEGLGLNNTPSTQQLIAQFFQG